MKKLFTLALVALLALCCVSALADEDPYKDLGS